MSLFTWIQQFLPTKVVFVGQSELSWHPRIKREKKELGIWKDERKILRLLYNYWWALYASQIDKVYPSGGRCANHMIHREVPLVKNVGTKTRFKYQITEEGIKHL